MADNNSAVEDRIRSYLASHGGSVDDPVGRGLTNEMARAIGVETPLILGSILRRMESEGVITRDVRGLLTYRIALTPGASAASESAPTVGEDESPVAVSTAPVVGNGADVRTGRRGGRKVTAGGSSQADPAGLSEPAVVSGTAAGPGADSAPPADAEASDPAGEAPGQPVSKAAGRRKPPSSSPAPTAVTVAAGEQDPSAPPTAGAGRRAVAGSRSGSAARTRAKRGPGESVTLREALAAQSAAATASVDSPAIPSVDAPASSPVAPPVDAPVAAPVDAPVAAPVDAPVGSPAAPPVDSPVAAPVDAPVGSPAAPPVDAPAAPPVGSPGAPPFGSPGSPPGSPGGAPARPSSHFASLMDTATVPPVVEPVPPVVEPVPPAVGTAPPERDWANKGTFNRGAETARSDRAGGLRRRLTVPVPDVQSEPSKTTMTAVGVAVAGLVLVALITVIVIKGAGHHVTPADTVSSSTDACRVVSPELATTTFGRDAGTPHFVLNTCVYDDGTDELIVQVFNQNARALFDAGHSSSAQDVPGLGDGAYYVDGRLRVLRGPRLMVVVLGPIPAPSPDPRLLALAKNAVVRL